MSIKPVLSIIKKYKNISPKNEFPGEYRKGIIQERKGKREEMPGLAYEK